MYVGNACQGKRFKSNPCGRLDENYQLRKIRKRDQYINNSKPDFKDSILGLIDDKGVDFIFTACSSADAQEQALSVLAKRGAINFFGGLPTSGPGARNISVSSNLLHYSECTLTGRMDLFHARIALQRSLFPLGRLFDAFSGLITHRFRLSEIQKAFELRRDPKALWCGGFSMTVKQHLNKHGLRHQYVSRT